MISSPNNGLSSKRLARSVLATCEFHGKSVIPLVQPDFPSVHLAAAVGTSNCPGAPRLDFMLGRPAPKGPAPDLTVPEPTGGYLTLRINDALLNFNGDHRLCYQDSRPFCRCRLFSLRGCCSPGVAYHCSSCMSYIQSDFPIY
jgi:hypothetical protein